MKTLKPLWSPLAKPVKACWYTRDCFRDEICGEVIQGFDGNFYPRLGEDFYPVPVDVRHLDLNSCRVYLCDADGNKYDIPRVDVY